MAVLVPWAYQGNSGPATANIIGKRVMDTYFNLKKQDQTVETKNVEQTNEAARIIDNQKHLSQILRQVFFFIKKVHANNSNIIYDLQKSYTNLQNLYNSLKQALQ